MLFSLSGVQSGGLTCVLQVELDECCKILRDATPKSLVIMDGKFSNTDWSVIILTRTLELGRGTSTFVGFFIS